jgi:acetyl esterase/lipase/plastocyanin
VSATTTRTRRGACVVTAALLVLAAGSADARPLGIAAPATATSVIKFANVEYKVVGGVHLKLDIYVPQGPGMTGPFPGMLMIHSGGWADGSKADLKSYPKQFVNRGFVAYVMNFRQSCDPADPPPNTPVETCGYLFPTQLEDIQDSLVWVRENAPLHPEWKTMPDRVFAWGTSSGANLAANLATGWNLTGGAEGTVGWDKPDAVISDSGAMDLFAGEGSFGQPGRIAQYLGCSPYSDPPTCTDPDIAKKISPLYNLTADDPPMFLMQGTQDPILPIEDHAIPMYNAMLALGIPAELYEVVGNCHGAAECGALDPQLVPNTATWMHDTLGPFPPLVSIQSGPDGTTQLGQATLTFTADAGVTVKCSLDGAQPATCTSPVHLTDLGPGQHSFGVEGFQGTGAGDPSIYYWTVDPVDVTAADFAFTPAVATGVTKGAVVQWTNLGPGTHTVTDTTGMGLFDSGPLGVGATFHQVFLGAGVYSYASTLDPGMTGQVKLGVTVTPQNVAVLVPVTIQWAGDTAPAGVAFDVQIKRPGSSQWSDWMTGQAASQGTFTPDVAGTYNFRGRTRSLSNGAATGWSAATKLTVTG